MMTLSNEDETAQNEVSGSIPAMVVTKNVFSTASGHGSWAPSSLMHLASVPRPLPGFTAAC